MDRRRNGNTVRMQNNGMYVYGNTAQKKAIYNDRQNQRESQIIKKNREKAKGFDFVQLAIFVVAVIITVYTLVNFIKLQYTVTSMERQIASLESELNNKTRENDELENRIETSIDLVEIERIAIEELKMTRATEEQVVICEDANGDFVRQKKDISEATLIK